MYSQSVVSFIVFSNNRLPFWFSQYASGKKERTFYPQSNGIMQNFIISLWQDIRAKRRRRGDERRYLWSINFENKGKWTSGRLPLAVSLAALIRSCSSNDTMSAIFGFVTKPFVALCIAFRLQIAVNNTWQHRHRYYFSLLFVHKMNNIQPYAIFVYRLVV